MAVAALVGQIATICLPVSLLGRICRAMNDLLRPLRGSLYPVDQLARILAPLLVFVRIQQNVARVFERNDLVHVLHRWPRILEVAHPNVIPQRISLQPLGRAAAHPFVFRPTTLAQPRQLVEEHDSFHRIRRIWSSTGSRAQFPLPADSGSQHDQPYEIQPDQGGIAGYALALLYKPTDDHAISIMLCKTLACWPPTCARVTPLTLGGRSVLIIEPVRLAAKYPGGYGFQLTLIRLAHC